MKDKLTELTKAIAEVTNHMEPAKAGQVASDLEAFTNEAISPTPRHKWYEVTSSGLIDAAKAVGQIGAPVVKVVTEILGLLSGQVPS